MSESKYKDAWEKGFDSGVEAQKQSCIYDCGKDYDEYANGYQRGYQQGRADTIREVMDLLHEYRAIDCECCPANKICEKNDYCELVITRFLDYMKNNGE